MTPSIRGPQRGQTQRQEVGGGAGRGMGGQRVFNVDRGSVWNSVVFPDGVAA